MDDLNIEIISKNYHQYTNDVLEKNAESEVLFLSFLQGKINFNSFENTSIYDQKSIKNLLDSEEFIQKLQITLNQRKALYNLINNTENQIIKYIYLNFLDTPKTDLIYTLKTPKLLSKTKYKIIFWELLFTYKKHKNFEVEFQELIKKISETYPKKKVLAVLNFGIALAEKKLQEKI